MTLAFLFWFFCLLAILSWGGWLFRPVWPYWPHGSWLFLFILIIILGLRAFGTPIHG